MNCVFRELLAETGFSIIPFIVTVSFYFLIPSNYFYGYSLHYLWEIILKCAPIISLMIFILLYGRGFKSKNIYCYKLLCGLFFSCIGDGLLIIPGYFVYGMSSFSIAQICYIIAFGWTPLRWLVAIPLYVSGISFAIALTLQIDSITLFVGLPIYTALLVTMCWRAIARINYNKSDITRANITKIGCGCGSILFVISDLLISIDMFLMPINNRTEWIMSTYYAAQLLITFSVVGTNELYNRFDTSNQNVSFRQCDDEPQTTGHTILQGSGANAMNNNHDTIRSRRSRDENGQAISIIF